MMKAVMLVLGLAMALGSIVAEAGTRYDRLPESDKSSVEAGKIVHVTVPPPVQGAHWQAARFYALLKADAETAMSIFTDYPAQARNIEGLKRAEIQSGAGRACTRVEFEYISLKNDVYVLDEKVHKQADGYELRWSFVASRFADNIQGYTYFEAMPKTVAGEEQTFAIYETWVEPGFLMKQIGSYNRMARDAEAAFAQIRRWVEQDVHNASYASRRRTAFAQALRSGC